MDQPTRLLLELLADDVTDAVVARLAKAPAGKTELGNELGVDSREVARTLDLLLLAGLVRRTKKRSKKAGQKGGRPTEVWELADGGELEKLEHYVTELRHRRIDSEDGGAG